MVTFFCSVVTVSASDIELCYSTRSFAKILGCSLAVMTLDTASKAAMTSYEKSRAERIRFIQEQMNGVLTVRSALLPLLLQQLRNASSRFCSRPQGKDSLQYLMCEPCIQASKDLRTTVEKASGRHADTNRHARRPLPRARVITGELKSVSLLKSLGLVVILRHSAESNQAVRERAWGTARAKGRRHSLTRECITLYCSFWL